MKFKFESGYLVNLEYIKKCKYLYFNYYDNKTFLTLSSCKYLLENDDIIKEKKDDDYICSNIKDAKKLQKELLTAKISFYNIEIKKLTKLLDKLK